VQSADPDTRRLGRKCRAQKTTRGNAHGHRRESEHQPLDHPRRCEAEARASRRRRQATFAREGKRLRVIVLRGDRCSLRPWRLQDALLLPELANDADIARFMTPLFPHPYRLHDAQAWVRLNQNAEPTLNFAIEYGGTLAGGVGLMPGDEERGRAGSTAIGYWLGKRFWGQGIATEAVSLLSEHAFATLGVRRLWANVFAPNRASARVLEKAGFRHEATLNGALVDRSGTIHDELIYVLFRGTELQNG
jgi:RimJ/RimL family protein N-acetyltransferase